MEGCEKIKRVFLVYQFFRKYPKRNQDVRLPMSSFCMRE